VHVFSLHGNKGATGAAAAAAETASVPSHQAAARRHATAKAAAAAPAEALEPGGGGGGGGGEDGGPLPQAPVANTRSGMGWVRRVIPGLGAKYLESEWSCAQVRGIDVRSIVAFGTEPGTVVVVGADGSFVLSSFAEGGEAERVEYARFMKHRGEEDGHSDDDEHADLIEDWDRAASEPAGGAMAGGGGGEEEGVVPPPAPPA
jgi:hypothetical protein